MIDVYVGSVATENFFVHERLIPSRSLFFAKALSTTPVTKWHEAEERKIELRKDEPHVFSNYMQLLYRGTLPFKKPVNTSGSDPNTLADEIGNTVKAEYGMLSSLYIFVDKIQDASSKRLALAAFMEAWAAVRADGRRQFPGLDSIRTTFEGTSDCDPLREWLVDQYVRVGTADWVSGIEEKHRTRTFFFQVYRQAMIQRPAPGSGTLVAKEQNYYLDKISES